MIINEYISFRANLYIRKNLTNGHLAIINLFQQVKRNQPFQIAITQKREKNLYSSNGL